MSTTNSWVAIVHAEAAKVGRAITDEDAGAVLWEHTGYPSFYDGDDPVVYFTQQIRDFFAGRRDCYACGAGVPVGTERIGALLCATCQET